METVHPVAFIVALLLVTIWHELGHLTVARLVKVPVRRIYVGMGPVLWQRSIAPDTELVLRALPLGMSIAVPGRRGDDGVLRRPLGHDVAIVAAGPAASLLLTGLLFALARWGGFPEAWGMALVGVGLLSTAVALLNLVPIPGLDGGHLLMLALDKGGRRLPQFLEGRLHRWGMHLVAVAVMMPLLLVVWRL